MMNGLKNKCLVRHLWIWPILILLAGCAAGQSNRTVANTPIQTDTVEEIKSQIESSRDDAATHQEGSLWEDNSTLADMFVNPKAKRVGDVVTVRIVESSQASNEASTKTGRDSSIAAGVTNFFGAETQYPPTQGFFNPFGKVGSNFKNEFEGSGSTKRSGNLTAYITTRVVDILPNDNLVIKGSREVLINNEKQVITLSGIVRPMDITATNEIQSIYISDARISYSGSGIINEKQRPGWLSRTLDNIWPF